ncbi:MAG TPA: hypothetical protein VI078_10010 [bacterium]
MGEAASLESRVLALEGQIEELRRRVGAVESVRRSPAPATAPPWAAAPPEVERGQAAAPVAGAVAAGWSGSSVLAKVSTVCFLLVIALGLRTVADSGAISPTAGAFAGLGYAAALIVAGWVLYARRSELAPVFAVCGAALLCSIVVETYAHFGSLPGTAAYLALGATALAMTAIGERHGTPLPGTIGVLGAMFSGIALSVPHPDFGSLAALLLFTSALGAAVSRRLKGDWIGWTAFLLSAAVLVVWAVRIRVSLTGGDPAGPLAGRQWFPPLVWAYALFWLGQSLAGLLRPPRPLPTVLSLVLPSLGAAVAFLAGLQVAAAEGDARAHGVAGLLLAAVLVGVAAWSGLRAGGGAPALNAYAVAAVILFTLGFSAASGSLLGALPLLSVTAFGFAVLSVRWESGGARLVSYLLQIFVALALAAILLGGGTAETPGMAALASLVLALVALGHYRWCRRHSPAAASLVFRFLGATDRCSLALLTASLAGGFFLLRTAAFLLLGGGVQSRDVFLSVQSLVINVAGVALFALAARGRSRELRTLAVLVTLVGAAKVFLYDLIAVHGVSRLASVFSFGLLAAVASVVLGRWQRRESP